MGGEDIRKLREKLVLSQEAFAKRFGFKVGTLRHWEQGTRYPKGPALVLLSVIKRSPEVVSETVQMTSAVA